MEVIRKCKKEVKKVQVGDQIVLGRYTATAVAQDASGTTFCFDQVYGDTPAKTPFDWKRMKALYKSKAMESVRDKFVPLFDDVANVDPADLPLTFFRSPTAEEVFAKQQLRPVEPTTIPGADKRLDIMRSAAYRAAVDVNGRLCAYWTDSLVKPDSPTYEKFGSNVYVNHIGCIEFDDADRPDNYIFWRPVFKLKV